MGSDERFELLGAPLDPLTMKGAVAAVEEMVRSRSVGQHASLNAAKVVRLQSDEALGAALRSCELVTADGQAVVWAARLLGHHVPERVAGADLMPALLARAEALGFRVYLLGAHEETIAAAEAAIRRRHPGITIAGSHHGYFGPEDEEGVVAKIAEARPDLLFVALETPQKELFLARHRDVLRIPFAMGVGGTFELLAGNRRRAPVWAQRAGLEWLFRLAQEPRRLGGRYVVGNARFVALVGRELVRRQRLTRSSR
jgi:N-acetylglucosaminyldiphosphoundecaprenol N-acetyl-beta-D-mannosaminyltransferase